MSTETTPADPGEHLHGWRRLSPPAPTRVDAARPAPLYGLAAFFVVVSVVAGVIVYSYVHLSVNVEMWPPVGVQAPSWWQPATAVGLVALATFSASRAFAHASLRDDEGAAARHLVATALLGIGAAGCFIVGMTGAAYDVDAHSYAAIVTTALGLMTALVAAGSLTAAVVAVWVVRGHAGSGVADAPRVVRAFWWGTFGNCALITAVVLLGARAW